MQFRANELKQLIREAFGDAYRVLGVQPTASADEIRRAYRQRALALHPDRNPGKDTSREMTVLNAAWTLLSDPEKRRKYDSFGDRTVDTFDHGTGQRPQPPPAPAPAPRPYSPPYTSPGSAYSPPPPPRPQPQPSQQSSPAPRMRYFEYIGRNRYGVPGSSSAKFWWIVVVGDTVYLGYGKIGSRGQQKSKHYDSPRAATSFARRLIINKLNKGYKETYPRGYATGWTPPAAAGPKAAASSPPKPSAASPQAGAPKKTYKIYGNGPPGDRRGAPAHTGFKGKFYKAPGNTKFHANDQAEVELGDDGKLRVKNPSTGHTQSWTGESVSLLMGQLITEVMLALDD